MQEDIIPASEFQPSSCIFGAYMCWVPLPALYRIRYLPGATIVCGHPTLLHPHPHPTGKIRATLTPHHHSLVTSKLLCYSRIQAPGEKGKKKSGGKMFSPAHMVAQLLLHKENFFFSLLRAGVRYMILLVNEYTQFYMQMT